MRIYSNSMRNNKFYNNRIINGVPTSVFYQDRANNYELESFFIADAIAETEGQIAKRSKIYTIDEDVEMVYVSTGLSLSARLMGCLVKAEPYLNYIYNLVDPGIGDGIEGGYSSLHPFFKTYTPTENSMVINTIRFAAPYVFYVPQGADIKTPFGLTENSLAYDWFDAENMGEDAIWFFKGPEAIDDTPSDMTTTQYTCDLGHCIADVAALEGIYSVADVIKVNED